MSPQSLVFVALVASACAAHAGVVPAAAAAPEPSAFLSGWTVANGAVDVVGALGARGAGIGSPAANLSMVAGIKYSAGMTLPGDAQGAGNGLLSALYGSVSSNYGAGQNGALNQSSLFYKRGIDGMYLLSSANFAALSIAASGGGSSAASAGTGPGYGQQDIVPGDNPILIATVDQPRRDFDLTLPFPAQFTPGGPAVIAAEIGATAIPEPGTSALMLAGLAGAGFLSRRRRSR